MSVGKAVAKAMPKAGQRMTVDAGIGITATVVTAVAGHFAPARSDVANLGDTEDDIQAPKGSPPTVPEDSLEYELQNKYSYEEPSATRVAASGAASTPADAKQPDGLKAPL